MEAKRVWIWLGWCNILVAADTVFLSVAIGEIVEGRSLEELSSCWEWCRGELSSAHRREVAVFLNPICPCYCPIAVTWFPENLALGYQFIWKIW